MVGAGVRLSSLAGWGGIVGLGFGLLFFQPVVGSGWAGVSVQGVAQGTAGMPVLLCSSQVVVGQGTHLGPTSTNPEFPHSIIGFLLGHGTGLCLHKNFGKGEGEPTKLAWESQQKARKSRVVARWVGRNWKLRRR